MSMFGSKCVNPILRGVFDQRILHREEAFFPPYLAPKPKVMGTPNLACTLVFTEFFLEKLFLTIIVTSCPLFEK